MARPSFRALRGASDKMSSSLEQAEIILAAKEIVDDFNKMAKNMAQSQADSFAIVDAMRESFGPEKAESFESVLDQAIKNTITVLKNSKDAISREINVLNGEAPQNDMMDDLPVSSDDENTENPNSEETVSDAFAGDEAASGPEEEPLGRAKKESIEMAKKPLKEAAQLREIGTAALVESSLNDLVNWYLTEACHGMPEEKLSVISQRVKDLRSSDPLKLAGIISDKKNALNAQLASPVMAAKKPAKLSAVAEGKSYKRDPDDGEMDVESKRKFSKFNRRSRKEDDLEEGKSYRRDPEDDEWDVESKKKTSKFNRRSRKEDGLEEEIDESMDSICDSIKEAIDSNIKNFGKGMAHKVLETHLAKIDSDNLMEGKGEVTLEKVMKAFEKRFNVSPALHSIREARKTKSKVKEDILTPADKDKKATTGALASQIVKDKNTGNKTVASAAASLQGQDRVAANKTISAMKAKGQDPNKIKAKDFVDLTDTGEEK